MNMTTPIWRFSKELNVEISKIWGKLESIKRLNGDKMGLFKDSRGKERLRREERIKEVITLKFKELIGRRNVPSAELCEKVELKLKEYLLNLCLNKSLLQSEIPNFKVQVTLAAHDVSYVDLVFEKPDVDGAKPRGVNLRRILGET